MESSTGGNTLDSADPGKPKETRWRICRERAAQAKKALPDSTTLFEGTDHEKGRGITGMVLPGTTQAPQCPCHVTGITAAGSGGNLGQGERSEFWRRGVG